MARAALRYARTEIDRTRYRAQQATLALSLSLPTRGMHLAMHPRRPRPSRPALELLHRRYLDLLAEDLASVEGGVYPRELLFQFPVGDYLRQLPWLLTDAPRVVRRRWRGDYQDLPPAAGDARFPAYYRRNFHWQTDGWFSERSARMYDLAVEFLFLGTADVMRRMAIPPVVEAARASRAPLRIADLACGTGRFLLQLGRALPDARIVGVDLSAPYLARARELLDALPGGRGAAVDLVAANVEATGLEGGGFDVVTSVFLFHELPSDARRRVVREARRLLRPGGLLVLLDAAQLTESPELEPFLDGFHAIYHEPYMKGYLRDDLGTMVADLGFEEVRTRQRFVSKLVVATAC
jgi:ubiquinone/menaquinone biosynthesis C-methylase UbiE